MSENEILEMAKDISPSITSSQISDSTAAGRAMLTAADAATQRTSLGLGSAATHASSDFDASGAAAAAQSASTTMSRYVTGGAMVGLRSILREGKLNAAIHFIGDSTGFGSGSFPQLFAAWLGTQYPNYHVDVSSYDTSAHKFGSPTRIQTASPNNGDLRWEFPATAAGAPNMPASTFAQPTGNLDVRLKIRLDALPAADMPLFGKATWPILGIGVGISPTGTIILTMSTSGVVDYSAYSSLPCPQSLGTVFWIRAVFSPGSTTTVTFYTSADGSTWSQLGTVWSHTGVITLYNNSSSVWYLGGNGVSPTKCAIYAVELRDATGATVNPLSIDSWSTATNTLPPDGGITLSGSPRILLLNDSVSGWGIADHITEMANGTMFPNWSQSFVVVNNGHNNAVSAPAIWLFSQYDTLLTALRSGVGNIPRIIFTTQNPRIGTTGWQADDSPGYNYNRAALIPWATNKGYGIIDTYSAFLDDGRAMSLLVGDIHPSLAGQTLITNLLENAYLLGAP